MEKLVIVALKQAGLLYAGTTPLSGGCIRLWTIYLKCNRLWMEQIIKENGDPLSYLHRNDRSMEAKYG